MSAPLPFRLVRGDAAYRQDTPTTCGSACLVMARMLAEPAFATWVTSGQRSGMALDQRSSQERFAAYEAVVKERTNRLRPARRMAQLPWPGALGTAPWGAWVELAQATGAKVRDYRPHVLRWSGPAARAAHFDALVRTVRRERPAIVYVGSATLPRHVCLIVPPADGDGLDVYEPSGGTVTELDRAAWVDGSLVLGGWPTVWLTIAPR